MWHSVLFQLTSLFENIGLYLVSVILCSVPLFYALTLFWSLISVVAHWLTQCTLDLIQFVKGMHPARIATNA